MSASSTSRVAPRAVLPIVVGVAAMAFLVLEPWHGPVVMALSEGHGVDEADLPSVVLIAVAIAVARRRRTSISPRRGVWGGRILAVSAIALGALLAAGVLDPRIGSPLVAAGGATLSGDTAHVDALHPAPVGRWTHLALTYDGANYRLYVNGAEVSSEAASGLILSTKDPLWIGGNRPYGEYFEGVIDEVRVYDRALRPPEVRAAMSTPVASPSHRAGLVAAYDFDHPQPLIALDASGHGNSGAIRGAEPAPGRFGSGERFAGVGEVVRVPASASLDLRRTMTLMAWIKPSERQGGWRTVLARQKDAYFLAAGGGRNSVARWAKIDKGRFLLVVLLLGWLVLAFVRGGTLWTGGAGGWHWAIGLFVAGSVADTAFAPRDTLIGPALVALWCAAGASHRGAKASLYGLAGALAALTILSLTAPGAGPLPVDAGGTVRAGALGLVLVLVGVLRLTRAAGRDYAAAS